MRLAISILGTKLRVQQFDNVMFFISGYLALELYSSYLSRSVFVSGTLYSLDDHLLIFSIYNLLRFMLFCATIYLGFFATKIHRKNEGNSDDLH